MPNFDAMLDFVIKRNPGIQQNKNAMEMIDILRNNDAARGEELARNLCRSHGMSEQDALNQTKQYFQNMLPWMFGGGR